MKKIDYNDKTITMVGVWLALRNNGLEGKMIHEKEKKGSLAQTSSKILSEIPPKEKNFFVDKPMEFSYYYSKRGYVWKSHI